MCGGPTLQEQQHDALTGQLRCLAGFSAGFFLQKPGQRKAAESERANLQEIAPRVAGAGVVWCDVAECEHAWLPEKLA